MTDDGRMGDEASWRTKLRSHPLLAGLSAQGVAEIADACVGKRFAAGEVLTREGEAAWAYWFLIEGSVRVFYTSPDGVEVTVKLFAAPAAWAEMQVLHGWVHTEDCVATRAVTCACLPRAAFELLLDAWPRFMKNVLLDAGARFLIAAQHERALAFLPVKARLAQLLLSYVRLYGEPIRDGVRIMMALSQDELANGLGVARKSVVRTFSEWSDQGIIKKVAGAYVVSDVEALMAAAPSDVLGIDWVAGTALGTGLGAGRRTASEARDQPVRASRKRPKKD